jgi:hypothetical protein
VSKSSTPTPVPREPWHRRVSRRPVYAAGVTLLGLLAGVFGSVYSTEIGAAFPFSWIGGAIPWHPSLFWGTAIATALLFFLRQGAIDGAHRESEENLGRRSDELVKLIRTLPPGGFLSTFQRLYWHCSDVLVDVLNVPTEELPAASVERAIRIVLSEVAALAHDFDGRPGDVLYAANIMLFRPAESLAPARAALAERLRFAEPETDLTALEGILDLAVELSTTQAEDYVPDRDLQPMALPVPRMKRSPDGRRSRVLPGAPRAFSERLLDIYADTHTLGQWCREKGDFSESVCKQVENYFRSQHSVRSFVSFPLMQLRDKRPVAVLNVHRNKEGILRTRTESEPEVLDQFSALIGPFSSTLLLLLTRLSQSTTTGASCGACGEALQH